MTAAELEQLIDAQRLRCMTADSPEGRRQAFAAMRELVSQRTPERIRQMERERGLA